MNEPPGARARVALTGLTVANTSVTRRDKMCFSLLTTFSDSHRLVLKCLLCLVVSHLLSVTRQPWPLTWVVCRRESPPPLRVPLPLSRPSTCPLTTCQIPPPPPPSLTWTPPPCCPELCPSVESTPLWIPSTPPPVSWTPTSSELSTTRLPEVSRRSSRTTNLFRISLPSWAWTSCPRRTSSRSPEQERSKDSFHSLSRSLRCSPITLASLFQLTRPSPDSRPSLPASTITCPRSPSTWSATSTRSLPRPRGWQLREDTRL